MDTLITVCAIIIAILLKVAFFLIYANHTSKKGPKKETPYKVHQAGAAARPGQKHILVTGGCGMMGSAIARHLYEQPDRYRVSVFDIAFKPGPHVLEGVAYIQGDLTTYTHVRIALADVDCVVHTAGMLAGATVSTSTLDAVNYQGTRNVIEACLERDIPALVYTSSLSVVCPSSGSETPILESTQPLLAAEIPTPYARSKAAAERLVQAANGHVLKTVVLRPGGIYGDQTIMTNSILGGNPLIAPGDLYVPFVWVEDAARAHVIAVQRLLFPEQTDDKAKGPSSSDSGNGAADAQQRKITGRAFHLCHDHASDPIPYREFFGGRPRGQEGDTAQQQGGGLNVYGLPYNKEISMWLANTLAAVNTWVAQKMGVVLIDNGLTLDNIFYSQVTWPADISDAKAVLGWEPTPWRQVAKLLAEQHRERKQKAQKARGGKQKVA